jgi:hypothetical protein
MFTKEDFNDQLLRMIVALKLSFASVSNVEFQRAFCCLNNTITFSSFFIIKNHLIFRAQKIQSILLKDLSDDIKIFLSMNCWSFFNRQEYLAVNAYFIDEKWNYHEVLLTFEHVTNSHTKTKLAKIMQDIIARHKLEERIYAIINDNAKNNLIMHEELVRLLRTRLFDDVIVRDIKRISCLAHVIQLTLKNLLDKIRINSKNENFRTSWNDKQNRATMKKKEKKVSYILAKISFFCRRLI